MIKIGQIIQEMIQYETGEPFRINHFLKVYAFAKAIGEQEGIDSKTQEILEVTAVMHDIGIKVNFKKYGVSTRRNQEIEGPPVARKILEKYDFDSQFIDRVCFIIAHHHSYNNIVGIDYQILIEADFMVNMYEKKMEKNQIESIKDKIFKTKTGQDYLERMFLQ